MFRRKRSSIAATLTLLAVLLLTSTFVSASHRVSIIYGPEAISTGGDEDTPQIAIDSNGNVHIVWVNDRRYLFYKMVDADGNVLIEETNLNPCADPADRHVRRPSLVIDSNDMVHVVFHGFSLYTDFGPTEYGGRTDLGYSEVIYLKIDPYLDDMDGDAADFYSITLIPETIISTNDDTKSHAPNMSIDPFDRLHVAWYDGPGWSSLDVHYLVMDTDGTILVGETTLSTGIYMDVDWGEPEIATDSNGNAHIVYSTNTWDSDRELYYTMVDGDNGNTLIGDTRMTSDDGSASVRAFLAVDSMDMVHVVWHDKRYYDADTGEHELFYSKLNPQPPTVVSVVSEKRITSNDGYRSYLKNLAIDLGDRIHITWVDMYGFDPDDDDWGKGEIYYQILDSSGDTIVPETRITYFDGSYDPAYWWDSSGRNPDIAVTCDKVYIAFNVVPDDGGSSDIYLTILRVPPCVPAVSGEILPINKLELVARAWTRMYTWIGLVSMIISAVAVSIVYVKHRKRKQT